MLEEFRRHRSYSQLSSFAGCGERYRLQRVIVGLPPRPAAWTALGNAFHTANQIWELSGRSADLPTEFIKAYESEIAHQWKIQPDPGLWITTPNVKSVDNDIRLRKEHGIKQAFAYYEHATTSEWKVWKLPNGHPAVELEFSIAFGEFDVIGAVDLVLQWPDGQLIPRDLKTGNKKNVKSPLQLGIYKLALQEIYGVDIYLGEYWFTKAGESGGYVNLDRYTRDYLSDQFIKLDFAIENEIYLANPGDDCTFCEVRPYCRELGSKYGDLPRQQENDKPV